MRICLLFHREYRNMIVDIFQVRFEMSVMNPGDLCCFSEVYPARDALGGAGMDVKGSRKFA